METLPVPVAPAEVQDGSRLGATAALQDALAAARDYALAEKADATRRAYASDFGDFAAWCATVERSPLPAEPATVAGYIASLADKRLKASTIMRRLAAIRHAHKLKGFEPPTAASAVKAVHTGIRRRLGVRPEQKAPATAKAIGLMLKRIPASTLAGKRDRALLLLGFAGALRRSEIIGLNAEDLEPQPGGLLVQIRKSKTDQEGRGQTVSIPDGVKLRPVEAIRDWTKAAGITSGPLFRPIAKGDRLLGTRLTAQSVGLIVKRWARAAKLDPAQFGGHSLRSGVVTSALDSGADIFAVADLGRWRKLETVREYDRRLKSIKNHAAGKLL